MNICFILIIHDLKAFDCSSFRYFKFKGCFSSEIFKIVFSEASAVEITGRLKVKGLNIE